MIFVISGGILAAPKIGVRQMLIVSRITSAGSEEDTDRYGGYENDCRYDEYQEFLHIIVRCGCG